MAGVPRSLARDGRTDDVCGINLASPTARALRALLFADLYDHKSQQLASNSGTTVVATPAGLARQYVAGSSQYVSEPLADPADARTILALCKLSDISTSHRAQISLGDSGSSNNDSTIYYEYTQNKFAFLERGGGAVAQVFGPVTANTSSWFFVAGVRVSATERYCYVNGLLSSVETTSVSPASLNALYIGVARYGGSLASHHNGMQRAAVVFDRALSLRELGDLYADIAQLIEPEQSYVPFASSATDYPVTATDALTLADSASQSFAATGVAADAMTLADSASNVAALGASGTAALTLADSASNVAALSATATDALSLADSASNVAALSATASDAMTLADTLNATASGDYTATGSDALTLADSAANAAALGATGSDALTLADAASNVAALGATASDALTLADTLNASASGDYVVTATDALSLSDSVVAAYAAICIATDALTLADATSAAMAGEYAATATDALTLADAVSNAAALGVSISEALTLAALVSALLTGNTALTGTRGGYGVQMQLAARRAQIQTGRRRN